MIKASLVVLDQVRVENTKLPLLFQTKISLIILTRGKRDDKIITPPIKASCYGSRPVLGGGKPFLVPLPTKASLRSRPR